MPRLVLLVLLAGCVHVPAPPARYDLLIRNGRIVDGSGAVWFRGDVAVRGDAIAAIAPRIDADAAVIVDAQNLIVAPGFIDTHTHARREIFNAPAAENYVRQGVTTIFEGPDGSSPLPIAEFLAKVAAAKPAVNFGTLAGHGSIREQVLGSVNRQPAAGELERMRALARQAMHDGAFGISTGLFYVPGTFAKTEEVIELAKAVAPLGGIHTSHMRDEGSGVVESVLETIRIGEEGGLPTQITHHKVVGEPSLGRSIETLRLVDEARARGVDVTIDQYPYAASSTGLASLLPSWALEGGREEMLGRIRDPELRRRIEIEVIDNIRNRRGGNLHNIQIASYEPDKAAVGKRLDEIAAMRGIEPTIENGARLVVDLLDKAPAQAIYHSINEPDLERILVHPATMIASDGGVVVFGKDAPHPRSYGTFPRVLGRYVREKKLLSLEEAVRKMTSLPAARMRLADRGLLRPGMKADIVVFDAARIADRATYENPHQYAEGVAHVIVNGEFVLRDGTMTGARPGQVLRLNAPSTARSRPPSRAR
jgi:N-acyl-D-amino-acid deacylase